MPPQNYDTDSDQEVVAPRGKKNRQPISDVEMDDEEDVEEQEDEQEDEEDEEEGEDEYVVEAIKKHRFDPATHELLLLVKWKGYDKKSDMTWEPEANCDGAKEIVAEYFRSVGGRPVYEAPSEGKKRARASTGGNASAKKKKVTPARDNSDGPEEPKWKPPAGSWEDEIQAIDTIEKTDKGLICYVQWGNGKKSQHEVHTVYKKAPQRMLHFYEQHLVFKESTGQNSAYKDGE